MQTTEAPKKNAKAQPTRERILDAAHKLFNSKGFHAMTTAELAAEAGVNIGLIYRHFSSKDDIVLTVVERKVNADIAERDAIYDAVQQGALSLFDAIKTVAYKRLTDPDIGLFFEILAESCRNPIMAERMGILTAKYRETIRHIASLVRPDASPGKLEVCIDVMIACIIGLGYRPAIGIADAEETSSEIARLFVTTLGV
jgi:TetR/AcrR family transcriptional regulator, repressor for uid operon